MLALLLLALGCGSDGFDCQEEYVFFWIDERDPPCDPYERCCPEAGDTGACYLRLLDGTELRTTNAIVTPAAYVCDENCTTCDDDG